MIPSKHRTPVAQAERSSARWSLWSSLVLTLVVGALLGKYSRPIPAAGFLESEKAQSMWAGIDFLQFADVRLLQRYVQIDTSDPQPDEVAGAEFLAAQLAAAGVPATIERFADRRANLWAFVEGEDPRAVVLLGHLDVEPALEQRGWRYPPFDAHVHGPWMYGRGMYDMKSLTIAQLLAFLDVARGPKPKRSLLFLQTSSEEMGSDTGAKWILAEHPELVARMDTLLTEGGVVEAASPTAVKYWGIEFAQNQHARLRFCAAAREDLEVLRRLLRGAGSDPRPEVDPAVQTFLARYAPSRDADMFRRYLALPGRLVRDAHRFSRLPPFLRALFRNEVVASPVEPDPEGGFSMEVWLHALPGEDLSRLAGELIPAWMSQGLARGPLEVVSDGRRSDIDHEDFRLLERSVERAYPHTTVGPFFLVQAMTDAQRFRAAGVRCYGFSPFPVVVNDTIQIARANERMQMPAFRAGVELYRQAIRELVE